MESGYDVHPMEYRVWNIEYMVWSTGFGVWGIELNKKKLLVVLIKHLQS